MTDNATTEKTVVAMFEYEDEASRATDELVKAGFSREAIHMVSGAQLAHPEEHVTAAEDKEGKVMGAVGKGLGIGGGVGAVAGTIAGLLVPGVGPLVLGGALAAAFAGGGLGASVGGVIAGFMNAGVNESDARLFETALRHGGVVLVVHTDDAHVRQAVQLLDRSGALDMDEHGSERDGRGVDEVEGSAVNRVSDTGRDHSTPVEERRPDRS